MKRSDYKYHKQENFLDNELYKRLCNDLLVDYVPRPTTIINADGSITEDSSQGKGRVRSYHNDLELWRGILPDSSVEAMYKIREIVLQQGLINPQPREFALFVNPESMSWHRDYNIEGHPDNQRYVTFLTMGDVDIDICKFIISINSDGPGLWKIGLDEWVRGNTFLSHIQTMGHEFQRKDKDIPAHVFSVQWYDIKS